MQPGEVFSIGLTLVDIHLNLLNWFYFLKLMGGLPISLIDCMIFLSPYLDVIRIPMSTAVSLLFKTLEFSVLIILSFDL